MLSAIKAHINLFQLKKLVSFLLIAIYALPTNAQISPPQADKFVLHIKPHQDNYSKNNHSYNLNERFSMPKHQLMYWNAYYLTPEQIERQRRNKIQPRDLLFEDLGNYLGSRIWNKSQSAYFGQQVAEDIVGSVIQTAINGKPKKSAVGPKF